MKHKASTCWYHQPFCRIYQYQINEKRSRGVGGISCCCEQNSKAVFLSVSSKKNSSQTLHPQPSLPPPPPPPPPNPFDDRYQCHITAGYAYHLTTISWSITAIQKACQLMKNIGEFSGKMSGKLTICIKISRQSNMTK